MKRKWPFIALIAALVVIIGILAVLLLRPDNGGDGGGQGRDPNAAVGQIQGKTQAEIQAELDKIVEDGMLNISINSDIVFESGDGKGDVRIENIKANRLLISVQIVLDDTNEIVYETGIIEPGYHIQDDYLDVPLDKGVYAATAMFTAYDPDTEAAVGQAAARVTITVRS